MKPSFGIAVLLAAALPACAGAQIVAPILPIVEPIGTVSVTGTGLVDAVPNIARLTLTFSDQRLLEPSLPVTPELRVQNLSALQQEHATRVAPLVAEVQAIVSARPAVQARDVKADQRSQPVIEYQEVSTGEGESEVKTNKSVFRGHSVTTTIEITLRGSKEFIEQRLGKLFDSATIKPDYQSDPVYDLSGRRRAAAERNALKKAMKDAQNQAQAQLLPGERLGSAIQRGEKQQNDPYRGGGMRAMAMSAKGGAALESAGASITKIGTQPVEKATTVVFQVLPQRLPRPMSAQPLKRGKR